MPQKEIRTQQLDFKFPSSQGFSVFPVLLCTWIRIQIFPLPEFLPTSQSPKPWLLFIKIKCAILNDILETTARQTIHDE